MLFNSYGFIFAYLPLALSGFFLIARYRIRVAAYWLVACSLGFYGYWDWQYVPLLLVSIAFNFLVGILLVRYRHNTAISNWIFWFAILANLVLLAWFKYVNFFLDALGLVIGVKNQVLQIVLPLGISFFTFTQIAYLADVKNGKVSEFDPLHYLLFVTYFPHLIAGPVLHHKQMMPQFALTENYSPRAEFFAQGITLFIIGLSKKTLIADSLALGATPMFKLAAAGGSPTLIEAWSGVLCYSLQLYFDFSGYSDMAVGLSMLFGIRLPINFSSPYKATSMIEFWRRWHMTLSSFLRDYLYIPLGGSRCGEARRYLNVFLTMLLGGMWHGAGWTFLLWGVLHGIFIVSNHFWAALSPWRTHRFLGWILTMLCVVVAWVPFRAVDLKTTIEIYCGMIGLNGISLPNVFAGPVRLLIEFGFPLVVNFNGLGTVNTWISGMVLPLAIGVALLFPNSQQWAGYHDDAKHNGVLFRRSLWQAISLGALFSACLFKLNDVSEFIYFQF